MGLFSKSKKNSAPAAPAPAASAAAPAAASDDTLIAVISAAIAAYQAEGGTGNLVVRKIRRISGEATGWSTAAIWDCIESRKF